MNFPCMNLFMILLCLWLCKLFVTIATRKFLSLPWNLSYFDCAKFCYNCQKKMFFYFMKYFMNLHYLQLSKIFFTIATRKWFLSPCIYIFMNHSACDCASFLLQLPQENIFLNHEIFHESSKVVIVQTFAIVATGKCLPILLIFHKYTLLAIVQTKLFFYNCSNKKFSYMIFAWWRFRNLGVTSVTRKHFFHCLICLMNQSLYIVTVTRNSNHFILLGRKHGRFLMLKS